MSVLASDNANGIGNLNEHMNHGEDVLFLTADAEEDNHKSLNGLCGDEDNENLNGETNRKSNNKHVKSSEDAANYSLQVSISIDANGEFDDHVKKQIYESDNLETTNDLALHETCDQDLSVNNKDNSHEQQTNKNDESINRSSNDLDLYSTNDLHNSSELCIEHSTSFNETHSLSKDDNNLDVAVDYAIQDSFMVKNQRINDLVANDMKYLFKNTRYFLIKSNNYENVNLAKLKGVWSTPRVNEIKLNKAYKECANVILIFSVAESGRFQGCARLSSECLLDPDMQVNWILPPNLTAKSLMGVFKLDWITKNDLYFTKTQQLLNPWNEMKQVKIGRDGQEIEPHCGESLCRLFDLSGPANIPQTEPTARLAYLDEIIENLTMILEKSKQRHIELASESSQRYASKSSSKDREISGEESSNKKKMTESEDETKDRNKSPSSDSSKAIAVNNNYNNRNRKDYNYQYSSSSYRNFKNRTLNTNYNSNYPPHRQQHSNSGMMKMNYNSYHQQQAYNSSLMNPHQPQSQHFSSSSSLSQNANYSSAQFYQNQPFHSGSSNQYSSSHSSESSSRRNRNRSSSPNNKKRRTSPKYVPLPEDVVLNSTYEEYVKAAAAAAATQLYQNDPLYYQNNANVYDPNNPYTNYNLDYSSYLSQQQPDSKVRSKYEQDVEEFLRRTAGTTSTSSSKAEPYKQHQTKEEDSYYKEREKGSSSSHHYKEHQKYERDHHRYRSSSRDRDRDRRSRQKSRERR